MIRLSILILLFNIFIVAISQNLTAAVRANDFKQVSYLLALGSNPNDMFDGEYPLIAAVKDNKLEMAVLLLDSGADVNLRIAGQELGSSAVHTVVKYGDTETLQLLINYGADLNGAINAFAYFNRQDSGAEEIVRILLENGAFLDEGDYFYDLFNDRLISDYYPCLLEDIHSGFRIQHCHGAAALISQYLNAYNTNNFKFASLAFASAIAGADKIQALIDAGLDPNEKIWRTSGNKVFAAQLTNPLEIALMRRNPAAVNTLLANGALLDNVRVDILKLASLDENLSQVLRQHGLDTGSLKAWFEDRHHVCQTPVTSSATISFILDDGERRDKELIKNIFEPRGIQGSLAIVAGYMGKRQYMNAQELLELQAKGWEIASHTYYHQDLSSLDEPGLEHALLDSQNRLSSLGMNVKSLVYPYGSYNETVETHAQKYYRAAFTGGYFLNSAYSDPFALGRYNINNQQPLSFYKHLVNKADKGGSWLVFAVHSSYDLGWEQRENLEQLLDFICREGIEVLPANQALNKIGF